MCERRWKGTDLEIQGFPKWTIRLELERPILQEKSGKDKIEKVA